MKTRRNFVKGLFGFAGCCLVSTGLKAASKQKINKDYEAGMKAAIRAGKGPAPTLGWTCTMDINQNQPPLYGKITSIDFENKSITVRTDSLIKYLKSGGKMKPNRKKR